MTGSSSNPSVLKSQSTFVIWGRNFRNFHFAKKELEKDTSPSGLAFARGIPEPTLPGLMVNTVNRTESTIMEEAGFWACV